MAEKLIAVIGPTAGGKTSLAAHLAYQLNGEIISADSRQVYRKMDIGTGKDLDDYIINDKRIPFHLIDIKDPGYKYNVFEFQNDFLQAYKDVVNRKAQPIMCGGTGLYIESVINGYKLIPVPENSVLRNRLKNKTLSELEQILNQYKALHNVSDLDTAKRAIRAIEIAEFYQSHSIDVNDFPKFEHLLIGIRYQRNKQRKNITERLQQRLKEGMIEEAQNLLDLGLSYDDLIYYGLEYKFLGLYLKGEIDYSTMFEKLNTAIHQFAKRQVTWFRKMERQGHKIHWIEGEKPFEEKLERARSLCEKFQKK